MKNPKIARSNMVLGLSGGSKRQSPGLLFNPTTAYEADSFVLFCFILFAEGGGLLLFSSSESQLQKGRPDGFK